MCVPCTEEEGGLAPDEATRFQQAQAGCPDCLNTLMTRHEGLVQAVVRRQVLGSLPFSDALHAARLGLWRAILRYDPTRGTAFSTYAWPSMMHQVWRAVKAATPAAPGPARPPEERPDLGALGAAGLVRDALHALVRRLPPHFLQRLDHEMMSPVSAARGVLAWLETTPLNAAQQRGLAELYAQLRRVSDLTTDMRRVADLRTRLLDFCPVDVEELAREALQTVQGEGAAQLFIARGGRLTCERKTPWQLPTVLGDPDLLSLALCNLLQNACKFTEPPGQVQVVLRDERPGVSIEVIDAGRGIPPEDLARVGQELYRGQNVGNLPGRGLGLALARAIVERHKGTLEIRSTAGQGTVATVRLPLNKEEAK